ncbi:MAG: phosphatidylinositol-specific phospholipase C1-like protein [Microthrixaceae bacterium]
MLRLSPPRTASVRRAGPGVWVLILGLAAFGCTDDADEPATADSRPVTTSAPLADSLRLNELQVVGTHNSFHKAAPPEEQELLAALNPEEAAKRTYSHPGIETQLVEEQVRQIELDVFADADGGLYANPALRGETDQELYVVDVPAMARPGTKVLHEQDVDYHSVCPTLVGCLTEVREFSDANPDHVPIAIHIQFKDGPLIFDVPDQAVPEQWTAAAMQEMEREITSVFDRDRIITPDDVRGVRDTLEEAVLADGWPTLGASRGKVMFLMINPEPYRSLYLLAHPNLDGALMFTNADPGKGDASYVSIDDPIAEGDRIAELVDAGYLVRTRADEPNVQSRTGDTTTRDAALAGGAQWVSTDYPAPRPDEDGEAKVDPDYVVGLPGGHAARCNPVTAPDDCEDAGLEP